MRHGQAHLLPNKRLASIYGGLHQHANTHRSACHLGCANDIIAPLAAAATSSEEENSVDAAEEQRSRAHVCGQLALDADLQAAVSPAELPDEPQSRHRPKRHLSRSLDLSRTSISSRPAKQQRLGKVLECMSLVCC